MQIQNPSAQTRCNELDLIGQHLPLAGATVLEQVQERFNTHVGAEGAKFPNPARFDVLRKPLA